MSKRFDAVVLTCEHGGNDVPEDFTALFRGRKNLLATHRGYDLGALEVARGLAKALRAPLHYATTTRLLVDLNRSLHLKGVWSSISRSLDDDEKAAVVARHYRPYRRAVESRLARLVLEAKKRVLHLSIHSFTPSLNGEVRNAEVGILYDPQRRWEADLARRLAANVEKLGDGIGVRRNYPYVGYSDGFTTHLRRLLPAGRYAGIEIETRQDELITAAGRRRYVALYAAAVRAASFKS